MQYNFTKEGYDALTTILFGENPEILKDEGKIEEAAQVVVDNLLRVIGNAEFEFKIRNLARYNGMGPFRILTHLVNSAYMEAEDAGVVPVDPWSRNPFPKQVMENNSDLWNSFPELLRDLHIPHEIELEEDEGGQFKRIILTDPCPTDYVDMYMRYEWDSEIQAYNRYLDAKLEISTRIEADEGVFHTNILNRMKNLDQLFKAVFDRTIDEYRYEREYT